MRAIAETTSLRVIDLGRIAYADALAIQRETHAELVAQGGWYAERWHAEQERGDLANLIEGIPAGTALVR